MTVAVVDTGVIIGAADSDDEHHEAATEIVTGIDRGDLPTGRLTDAVILESLNFIHDRKRHRKAVETRRRLNESAGFEIHQAPRKDYHRAVELFETYDGFSFGDASIAAYLEREGIEYLYSFDDDFDVLDDVTRLDTAVDPFD